MKNNALLGRTASSQAEVRVSRKFLFLDIDGVLNWRGFLLANSSHATPCSAGVIDPDKVELINQVVAATGCDVVLSSTWRLYVTLPKVQQALDSRGARFVLVGATPDGGECRGEQIRQWLEMSGLWGDCTFAIVDDDSDMGTLLPRLVRTRFDDGLLPEQALALVELLREERRTSL